MNEEMANESEITALPATSTAHSWGWNDGNSTEHRVSELSKVVCDLLFFVTGLTVVFFNAVLVIAILWNKSLHRTINYYILSRSLSDILYGVKTIVNYGFTLQKSRGHCGEVNGKDFTWIRDIKVFLFIFSIMNSMLCILALTVQRYRGIVQYMKQPLSKKCTTWTIFLIWMSSMSFSVTYTVCLRITLDKYPDWQSIWRSWSLVRIMDFVFFILAYVVPVVFMSILFYITARRLRQTEIIDHFSTTSLQRKKRALKMIFIVFVLFLLTWSPYFFIVFYMNVTLSTATDNRLGTEFYLSFLVGLSYSWINVVVYLYFSRELRTAMFDVLRCRFSCVVQRSHLIPSVQTMHRLDCIGTNVHFGKLCNVFGSQSSAGHAAKKGYRETTRQTTHF